MFSTYVTKTFYYTSREMQNVKICYCKNPSTCHRVRNFLKVKARKIFFTCPSRIITTANNRRFLKIPTNKLHNTYATIEIQKHTFVKLNSKKLPAFSSQCSRKHLIPTLFKGNPILFAHDENQLISVVCCHHHPHDPGSLCYTTIVILQVVYSIPIVFLDLSVLL